jgi:TonB-dependent SusC/RagA subfamily outer membrane receptor
MLSSSAQTRTVHGHLTAFRNFAVYNMEVKSKKSKDVVRSDSTGWFQLQVERKDVILIRDKVFEPVTCRVNEKMDTIHLNLIFIDSEKNRKVATGFGYLKKDDLGFAMNHLHHQNNDFCNYSNVYELIEGRFPGVQVDYNGNRGSIIIRGRGSFSLNSSALTVVDGVITGDIGYISPCDISTIDIIKDGMSSMYGSKGGNGVVVIETINGLAQ